MSDKDPSSLRARIEKTFLASPFVGDLGINFIDCGEGWCETKLVLASRHMQFSGVVHAGVISTLADHSAGAAAVTLLEPGKLVVSAEFKISLLRGGRGDYLTCRGNALKSGRLISFVEAEVWAWQGSQSRQVAKLSATMVTVEAES